jgi:hypothetical protein
MILQPIGIGWRQRARTVGEGTFGCPNERCKGRAGSTEQRYRERQTRNWLILLHIPVIPLNTTGAYIECRSCKSRFSYSVLRTPIPR